MLPSDRRSATYSLARLLFLKAIFLSLLLLTAWVGVRIASRHIALRTLRGLGAHIETVPGRLAEFCNRFHVTWFNEYDPEPTAVFLDDQAFGDEEMKHLRSFDLITSLDLDRTQVSGIGLSHISGKQLTHLSLVRTPISESGLQCLECLTKLEQLNLLGTQLTDLNIQHLKCLTNLTRLNLGYTNITDDAVEQLRSLTELQVLELPGTFVTDSAAQSGPARTLGGLGNLGRLAPGGLML
ncbi:MAG: hypothetical protein EXS05_05540 [Planctomycetaceae bacterium]|nr:hypothetical protein [Planctomycetaceae bacterium]